MLSFYICILVWILAYHKRDMGEASVRKDTWHYFGTLLKVVRTFVPQVGCQLEEETKGDPRSLWWKLRKEEYFIEFR